MQVIYLESNIQSIKNSQFNNKRQTIQLKNGQRSWTVISPKKIHKWPKVTQKDAQYKSLVKCKSKPQWDYHFIHTRMATIIIFKMRNNKCRRECGEIGTPVRCWWECKMVQPLWKISGSSSKKINIELPYYLAIPLLGVYPQSWKQVFKQTPVHGCSWQTVRSTNVETSEMSVKQWTDKQNAVYPYNGMLLIKKGM